MLQELFRIPGLDWPVYGYGLMLVLGVYAAIELGRYLANRHGISGDYFVTMGLLALAAGVVGARLSHVLENLGAYTREDRSFWQNLLAAANLSSGGLTFYGGFILSVPVLFFYLRWRKIPVRLAGDIVAPCIMLGLAFGRVGCLLNGCCWGQVCDPNQVPWAVTFPYDSPPYIEQYEQGQLEPPPTPLQEPGSYLITEGGRLIPELKTKSQVRGNALLEELAERTLSLHVHPAQIYCSLTALLVMFICLAYLTLRRSTGQVFAMMLILYGIGRFVMETLRVEPAVRLFGLDMNFSFSMWVSVLAFVAGVTLWLVFQRSYIAAPVRATNAPK